MGSTETVISKGVLSGVAGKAASTTSRPALRHRTTNQISNAIVSEPNSIHLHYLPLLFGIITSLNRLKILKIAKPKKRYDSQEAVVPPGINLS